MESVYALRTQEDTKVFTNEQKFDEKFSALQNFEYGQDLSLTDSEERAQRKNEEAIQAFIKSDEELTLKLNEIMANIQKTKQELEDSR